ncbi:hypothetical protein F4X33_04800 [Candidatus Poribacteria bacterium]|nr:hypothetical protein [Candidatus Poribacteria bacterium]
MTASQRHWRILSNDDGWIMGTYGPPLLPDDMRNKMIAPYAGSPVDVFLWSIGGHEVYDYETEVGERFGDGYDDLDADQQRKAENLRHMITTHGGPVTVIAELCQEAGMAFFPSVRMNEHYDMEESAPNYGQLRRDHPELCIGRPGESIPHGSLEWGIRTGLNYAFPEVRAHMSNIIFELIERFDIDGIELDFMRHPAFFRVAEAYQYRYLMTDFVDGIRAKVDEVSKKRGKQLALAVRVPPTLADCKRIGLDAEVWMKEGIVDMLIAGGGFIPFEMPISEWVETAQGTGCKIYGCFEGLRPLLNEKSLKALALRYWEAGVDGLYFFNYYSMSNDWKRNILNQLAAPTVLQRLNKCYELDHSNRHQPTSQLGYSFLNAIPAAQLPVQFNQIFNNRAVSLRLEIADDLESATVDGALKRSVLVLGFEGLTAEDTFEIRLNRTPIPWTAGLAASDNLTRVEYEQSWNQYPSRTQEVSIPGRATEFDIGNPPLKKGINELEIRQVNPQRVRSEPLTLKDATLSIYYK